MSIEQIVTLANAISQLGFTGGLIVLLILVFVGRLHTDSEKKDWDKDLNYREQLRSEAVTDRKAADTVVKDLSDTLKETNDLMRRSLDLNERLVEEYALRKTSRRNGGSVNDS